MKRLIPATSLSVLLAVASVQGQGDPCAAVSYAAISGYATPAEARACLNSFPFNETLRQNVLTVVSRVFDFYTFEDYYVQSPPPFQDSTVDIRATLAKLNATQFETDYEFNKALYDFVNQLNDGHTEWSPDCYLSFENLLPTPIVALNDGIYVAPDSPDLVNPLGINYTSYYDKIGFDWERLAGAKVLAIEGQDPWSYLDHVARTSAGVYLDHNLRVNSALSGYQGFAGFLGFPGGYGRTFGVLANPRTVDLDSLKIKLVPVNSTNAEEVTVPFYAHLIGGTFTNKDDYWFNNCNAKPWTNGADAKDTVSLTSDKPVRQMIASAPDRPKLPSKSSVPNLPQGPTAGDIQSYFLPGNKTGVLYVTGFTDLFGFQSAVVAAVDAFQAAGVERLLVDLSGNGGGYVCLGLFLFQYLAGAKFGYPGFQSTARGGALAQKIVASDIALGLDSSVSFYTPDNWNFLNGTQMPKDYNYMNPVEPITINGRQDATSQRFQDRCTPDFTVPIPQEPVFAPQNIAIVGNGLCASTCALFSTAMYERAHTKVAIFGGNPSQTIEYKAMAGNQVLEWTTIDSEIKTANLKDDPLAPPDLLVSANFRHNWRTAWSYFDEDKPIAYVSEQPQFRFPYTKDTYNSPENVWIFAESKLFP